MISCALVLADAKLRDIPVILMSAKGDQVGERFVKVMGIVDDITKPCSSREMRGRNHHRRVAKIAIIDAGRAADWKLIRG